MELPISLCMPIRLCLQHWGN